MKHRVKPFIDDTYRNRTAYGKQDCESWDVHRVSVAPKITLQTPEEAREVVRLRLQVFEHERKIASLLRNRANDRERLSRLEGIVLQSPPSEQDWRFSRSQRVFMQITCDIFGNAKFSLEIDPDSWDQYYVANVIVSGTDEEIDAMTDKWHARIGGELRDCVDKFALNVKFG